MNVTISIPADARVFLLEDSDHRIEWFKARIPNLVIANTAEEAIATLAANKPFDFVFLDHDLGVLDCHGNCPQGNGEQVAKHLAATGFIGKNVVIHSWNSDGAAAMKDILWNSVAIPFGQFEIKLC